ncbi:MAG: hypothetical protein JWM35_1290, partial [Verrucomicrobia bacterium]|nr:hypothetical protein [Verrucomicrobiota bacterium]
FLQATASQPLAYRDDYMPSANVGLNAGIRYLNATRITPQLQLNLRWDGRERGAEADVPNSGAAHAYVSPGLTAELGERTSAFAFVQLPVYQRVNGLQLEPRWLLSVGFRHQFR